MYSKRDGPEPSFCFGRKIMELQRKAVTLVELLIVVLLIGVMTFVAVPRMGLSLVNTGKAQTTAQTLAAAIRYCRTLAISNAATNQEGFEHWYERYDRRQLYQIRDSQDSQWPTKHGC